MNTTLEENFVNVLRNYIGGDLFIYYNLFSILKISNSNFLKDIKELYMEYPDNWFEFFHKTFRQIDVFDDSKLVVISRVGFSDEEIKRKRFLSGILRGMHRDKDKGTIKLESEYVNDETYIKYDNELKNLINKGNKITIEEDSICAHLDSIFWQTISNDKELIIYEYMDEFFKENY